MATYKVRQGDTLSQIGSKHDLNYQDIAKWNNISNPDLIRAGQTLNLSAPSTSTASKQTTTTAPKQTNTPLAPVDFDQYKAQSATIDDLAKKYGFDYSREYANRQAQAEAQAKRYSIQQGLRDVDRGVRSGVQGIDQNYFQQYLQNNQNMANRGMNAGIAQDSQTRLGMSQQGALADLYAQANNQRFQLNNDMSRIEQEALAREDALYNNRLSDAFNKIMSMNQLSQQESLAMLNAALQQRNQNIGMDQFDRTMDWNKYQFDNLSSYQQAQIRQQELNRAATNARARQQAEALENAALSSKEKESTLSMIQQLKDGSLTFSKAKSYIEDAHRTGTINDSSRQQIMDIIGSTPASAVDKSDFTRVPLQTDRSAPIRAYDQLDRMERWSLGGL